MVMYTGYIFSRKEMGDLQLTRALSVMIDSFHFLFFLSFFIPPVSYFRERSLRQNRNFAGSARGTRELEHDTAP